MIVKSISTSNNFTIHTENNTVCTIEITTYLGTTVFKDTITPINKIIKIKGLNPGKYIVNISNNSKIYKQQINIMKKIITLLAILITTTFFAQQTYIPDDNFEQALIDLGYDTVLDDYVLTANIVSVQILDIQNKNIADLTGIENFSGLLILNCFNNQLINLNVSQNTSLASLDCDNNLLEHLNVQNGNNSNFTSTIYGTDFSATNNPNLTCIKVDDIAYSTTNWSSIDAQSYFDIDCGLTYIPDNNFEQALIDLGLDSGVLDDQVITSNISSVTNLDISNKNITNLIGIEGFNSLQVLNCENNNLNSFDISQNTALTQLRCSNNSLATLDVSSNTNLDLLIASQNLLTNLNVTQNLALHTLVAIDNQLISIDVRENTQLGTLILDSNYITGLNLSQNTLLEDFSCDFNQLGYLNIKNGNNGDLSSFSVLNNPNLTCIDVDDVSLSNANWTNIDAQSYFSTDCGTTYIPDANFEQTLIDLGLDSGSLNSSVLTTNINAITTLNVSYKNIADLTGIKDFTALTNLFCFNNSLTSLDISQNTALIDLRCRNNQITSLDISQNIVLEELYCENNLLTNIDVTQNTALTKLDIDDNQLTSLDVTQNLMLINLSCENNQLTNINVSQNTLLELLFCSYNPLTTIDITQNTLLSALSCRGNQLSNLDITQNLELSSLSCGENQLTNLDLSLHTNLVYFWARDNQLTNLNVKNGNNTNFTLFNCNLNSDLLCVEVDDAAWSTANWTNIDASASFSENCTLSVNQFDLENAFNIYPNPVKEQFTIQNDAGYEIDTISIYTMLGKLIYQSKDIQNSIDLSTLSNGMYLVKLNSNNQVTTKKILINK